MMPVRTVLASVGILACLAVTGCPPKEPPVPIQEFGKDFNKPLPPGQLALRKITDPAMLPDFGPAYYSAKDGRLAESIRNSLHYLAKPSSQKFFPYGEVTHEQAVASLNRFLEILTEAHSPGELDQILKREFDTYISVGCDDHGAVKFTGYYCPIFDGSLTRTARFKYPLFKKPADLKINMQDPDGAPVGGPWHTRQEIESSQMMAGQELIWLGDRFETYVVTVQGSGKIRLPDGRIYEIGYAGNNGHEYTPIGESMIADGKISKDQLSLDTLIAYFKSHPEDLDHYLWKNERYVFFREAAGGPFGCLGEPVLPMHSIAVDKTVFPRACLAMFATRLPVDSGGPTRNISCFACDQDRGGAIRAAGRCDIFRGTGAEAGKLAGNTVAEGRLYYVFLKPENVHPTGPTKTTEAAPAGNGDTTPAGEPQGGEAPQ